MAEYSYSRSTGRYRDVATGRFVADATLLELRDAYTDAQAVWAEGLAARLAAGKLTPGVWELEMRERIKTNYISEFLLGRGGRNAVTQSEWGTIGNMLRQQYGYLSRFAGAVERGELSPAQIAQRAKLYFQSSRQAFEFGRSRQWDVDLPAHPGDGGSECGSNCRCWWQFDDRKDRVNCTWKLSAGGESCADCMDNGRFWNPLVFWKDAKAAA